MTVAEIDRLLYASIAGKEPAKETAVRPVHAHIFKPPS
jgi:hypothetical protein